MSQKSLIQDVVRGELLDDTASLKHYSRDASIFEVTPSVVLAPADLGDVQALVQRVAELKQKGEQISITPRAAGTCMSGGPLTQSIVLDMTKHFGGIHDIDTQGKHITVGSGAYYRDVEKALAEQGLLFPPYTSSKDLCAIGGMIGNNASGEKSLRYGATTNWVRTVYVVLADGQEYEFGPLTRDQLEAKKQLNTLEGALYRGVTKMLDDNVELLENSRPKVRKNAAGYALWRLWNQDKTEFNMAKLFVGAQGTLGVVTGAVLNVVDLPKTTRMVVIAIKDLSQLAQVLKLILAQRPEGLEVYDKHTYELSKQYHPKEAKLASIAEGEEMVLFAQFAEHTEDQTNHNAKVCEDSLKKLGLKVHYVTDPAESEAHWVIRRASYKMLKDHAEGAWRAAPFIEDTIVNPIHYAEFVAALETILADYDMTYTYSGHIGDGSIRLIPLVNLEIDGAAAKIFELARRVYNLVFAFGGSMSVDHNDGLIRTPFLEDMFGEDMVHLFEQTKRIFDPQNIFNPGKKVYGDLDYSMAHVLRTNND